MGTDKVTGDISGLTLPSSLTQLHFNEVPVFGDISNLILPSTLQRFYVRNNSVSGDIFGRTLPKSLQYFYVNNTSVSGDISNLTTMPSSLVHFYVSSTSVSGDISVLTLPSSLSHFRIENTSVSGDISVLTLPSSLAHFYINNTSVSYGSGGAFASIPTSLSKIDFDDCGLTYQEVDRVFADLVASGVTGKILDIAGTNSGPSYAGAADVNTLDVTNTWTVSVNSTVLGRAETPSPADEATEVSIYADLSWAETPGADAWDVYFGLASLDINDLYVEEVNEPSYDPGTLLYSTQYQWRIDANNAADGPTTGVVWTFTTEAEPEQDDPAEPVTGWQRSPIWNKTPQWHPSPPVWRKQP
jgi:hypothetical protein